MLKLCQKCTNVSSAFAEESTFVIFVSTRHICHVSIYIHIVNVIVIIVLLLLATAKRLKNKYVTDFSTGKTSLETHTLYSLRHTHAAAAAAAVEHLSPPCLHDAIFIITSPSLLPLMTPLLLSLILY